jgi:diguanylate cyclase (GGDEF)-like protein
MSENTLILITLSRVVFLITNILLNCTFLTSKHPIWVQTGAFVCTWAANYFFRGLLSPIIIDPFLIGYTLSLLYIIPITLVFQETLHAKLFVYFMVFSISQCIFLVLIYLEVLLFHRVTGGLLLGGLLLELASMPLIRRYIKPHVRNILEVIKQLNPTFALFPLVSFILVAFYGVQRTYSVLSLSSLVLTNILIFFSYYLIAKSIEQTKKNQQLAATARTDSLTGLYNRWHMEQRIQEEYERYQRTGSEFALIIADVDLFKAVNDNYGHDSGDCLLKALSEDIRKSVREYDLVARWGGDEFLLLLPATNAENAVDLAKRIGGTVGKRRYVNENEALTVTLTLGVSVNRSGDDIANIIKKADIAMYQGKRAGGNRVISFDSIANTDASSSYFN